jgi:signal peptidase I
MNELIFAPIPAENVLSDKLRVHLVDSDAMEPTLLNKRDYVLLAPVSQFVGDGVYAIVDRFGVLDLFRVQCIYDGKGSVMLFRDNKLYQTKHVLSIQEFEEAVVGYMVAEIKVKDERFLREACHG